MSRLAKDRAYKFWCFQADWSRKTFGSDTSRGPIGPLRHLKKEVDEALIEAEDKDWSEEIKTRLQLELVDCLFLVFDASRRAGMNYDDLLDKAFEKLEINKAREWVETGDDQPIEHKR